MSFKNHEGERFASVFLMHTPIHAGTVAPPGPPNTHTHKHTHTYTPVYTYTHLHHDLDIQLLVVPPRCSHAQMSGANKKSHIDRLIMNRVMVVITDMSRQVLLSLKAAATITGKLNIGTYCLAYLFPAYICGDCILKPT